MVLYKSGNKVAFAVVSGPNFKQAIQKRVIDGCSIFAAEFSLQDPKTMDGSTLRPFSRHVFAGLTNNMADCKISTDSLAKVPDTIGVSFMPNCAKILKTTMDRGLNKFHSVFLESIKVFEPCSDSIILQVAYLLDTIVAYL